MKRILTSLFCLIALTAHAEKFCVCGNLVINDQINDIEKLGWKVTKIQPYGQYQCLITYDSP